MYRGQLLNDIPRWTLIILWLAANIIYFVITYERFQSSNDYFYTRKILGPALAWARASAAALNLNCLLILLPVCRNLISYFRSSFQRCCNRNIRRQLDKHITFHKYIAYMICVHTAIHLGAHIFNVERYYLAYDVNAGGDAELLQALSRLGPPGTMGNSYLNFIRTSDTDPIKETFKALAGWTGIVITLALIVMVSSSTELIRRSYFEVFWFTHHLFVIFFIGLIVHGFEGIVRRQNNTDVHDPLNCYMNFTRWGEKDFPQCPYPEFEGLSPNAWKFTIVPITIYIIERMIRFKHRLEKVVITKVLRHPSKVFQLQMRKKGFKMKAGQYIFVNCPSLSRLEWHPFTLTSAPEDEFFSIHIRRVGDWTEDLAKACHVDTSADGVYTEAWKMPQLAVDGPFGTATEDIFWYEVNVFVAAGIGVTPFASVLKHIWYKHMDAQTQMKLRKVYFYWVCPDTNSFEWMQELLSDFDAQMEGTRNEERFLEYFIYLTRGWSKDQAENIILHEDESEADPVTGLQQKTHYGRPNWDKIFQNIATNNKGKSIGVFFCGPSALSMALHKACNDHSSVADKTKFFYNKENF